MKITLPVYMEMKTITFSKLFNQELIFKSLQIQALWTSFLCKQKENAMTTLLFLAFFWRRYGNGPLVSGNVFGLEFCKKGK